MYVDTNVFVYWLYENSDFHNEGVECVRKIEEDKDNEYFTSTFTVFQVYLVISHYVRDLSKEEIAKKVNEAISSISNLRIVDLKFEDLLRVPEYLRLGLDFDDSLHASIMDRYNSNTIISNDKDFDKIFNRRFPCNRT
ncbi:MAG: type II toxin-antitoxin system VapC family toxin [Sulfolobaceae archaeon]|nr:type II toxin-antitoxin system VapC family toxin [Sulfolobaceae archaeon]